MNIKRANTSKTSENVRQGTSGFRLCGMDIIANVFSLLKCPDCNCVGLSLGEDDANRKGKIIWD
jgi:hypothetical protein